MRDKVLAFIDKYKSLERQLAETAPHDTVRMATLAKERKKMEPVIQAARQWLALSDELQSLGDMIRESEPAMAELARAEQETLSKTFDASTQQLFRMLNPPDPRSDRDTIIEIRAGAGGDEAGLFVADLFRMYSRFAQKKGLDVNLYASSPTGVGGLKEIIFEISGANAFGWFRFEQGVHRVQRVPKTEAQGRIHTSTVTVAVLPEATDVEVSIDPKDLRIDTYRASGAGGQHVNKTESAIRITHAPTGLVVSCQEERSQGQNRLRAMALLRARLHEAEQERQEKERRDLRRKQIGSGDRSEKIRTYNFPQDRVTDHRINVSVHHIENFMEGEMEEMIAALQAKEEELLRGAT